MEFESTRNDFHRQLKTSDEQPKEKENIIHSIEKISPVKAKESIKFPY